MAGISLEQVMELSLDEYIQVKNIKNPLTSAGTSARKQKSKFDRYRDYENSDSDDDNDQETSSTRIECAAGSFNKMDIDDQWTCDAGETPPQPLKLLTATERSFEKGAIDRTGRRPNNIWSKINDKANNTTDDKTVARVGVHQRLGNNNQFRSNNNQRWRRNNNQYQNGLRNFHSVQPRLQKDFISPAMIEANHAQLMNVFTNGQLVKTFVETMNNISEGFKVRKEILPPDAEKKYDMIVQKDISEIQKRSLFFKCPGGDVVSFDGPGLKEELEIPQNITGMTLNQRFA